MEKCRKVFDQISSKPIYKFVPKYDIDGEIRALTLDGMDYDGKKTKFFAYYGVPANAKKPLPAVVLVHGGGGHAYHCWIRKWMERGFAAIAMDTTGYMPTQKNAGFIDTKEDAPYWSREWNDDFAELDYSAGPDNDSMDINDKSIDKQWMFHAVSTVIHSHNFLIKQPEIDNEKIGICGISWGGVITSIVLGFDTRFAFAIPIYGSGYLSEGLSEITKVFRIESVKNSLWIAENRFDDVKCPVLWMAWNDDSAFSINSNTFSFEHTQKNNTDNRISIINKMFHSHERAWIREESYFFAESIILKKEKMPYFFDMIYKNNILSMKVLADCKITVNSATLYYIDEPMKYIKYDKFGYGEGSFMAEKWKTNLLNISDGIISGVLPDKIGGFYVEILFSYDDKELVVTTGYKTI